MIKQLIDANTTILYNLCHYPLFLLDEDLRIISAPAHFLPLPEDFFCNHLDEVTQMIKNQRLMYMLYKHSYFYSFIPLKNEKNYLWIGPIIFYDTNEIDLTTFRSRLLTSMTLEQILLKIPILQENYKDFLQLVFQNVLHLDFSLELIEDTFRQKMNAENRRNYEMIKSQKRELNTQSFTYELEMRLLNYIRHGDAISARILANQFMNQRLGLLSKTKTHIPLFAFISMTGLVSRSAIEGGADIEASYGLNDLYIQKAEEFISTPQIKKIWIDMVVDFCFLVKQNTKNMYPIWVNQCIDFILRNLHQQITLEMIGREVHMLPSYVSVQFKKITNVALMNFIQSKKIEEASFLLKNTNTPILEISTLLAFSSQAYFASIFKKDMGVSPSTYRKQR